VIHAFAVLKKAAAEVNKSFGLSEEIAKAIKQAADEVTFCIVAIEKPERQVRKPSHCGKKQQYRSRAVITPLWLVRATHAWELFFTHISFVVNCTLNAAPAARLQQYRLCVFRGVGSVPLLQLQPQSCYKH